MTNPSVNVGQQVLTSPGTMVTFDASGSTDNTGIIDYLWNFGDGTSGTGVTTTHSYENSGNYTATLVVEDAAGNTATNHIAVTVQTQTLATIPEFPSILGISILMLAMLLSVLWLKKAKNSRPKPHPSCLHA
jgi:hypothetical protein